MVGGSGGRVGGVRSVGWSPLPALQHAIAPSMVGAAPLLLALSRANRAQAATRLPTGHEEEPAGVQLEPSAAGNRHHRGGHLDAGKNACFTEECHGNSQAKFINMDYTS